MAGKTIKTKRAPKKTVSKPAASRIQVVEDGKATKAKGAAKATAKKPATKKPAKERKASALDCAAKVLAASSEPMSTKQMIEAMAKKGLWSSPNGKTPHATLYSAILREINTKGKESRFVKTDRGHFKAK